MLELLLAASITALATGLGAIPVFLLGEEAKALKPALLGLAGGRDGRRGRRRALDPGVGRG